MYSLKDDVKRITAKEGNTVTLQPEVHALEIDAQILWSFNQNSKDSKIVNSQVFKGDINTEYSGRLKDRLLLDRNTGSLTIRNITTRESGIYRLQIISERISSWHFNCTVYGELKHSNT